MTNVKKRRIPVVTVLLFAIAISLLLFSSVGGARAALTYGTAASAYEMDIGMMSASIGLYENGSAVSGTLLADFGESDGTVIPGKAYPEELYVVNSSISNVQNGQVDEYIRVVIYCYWLDENDNKARVLCPRVYELYGKDESYSFYFSQDPGMEKSEEQIKAEADQIAMVLSNAIIIPEDNSKQLDDISDEALEAEM